MHNSSVHYIVVLFENQISTFVTGVGEKLGQFGSKHRQSDDLLLGRLRADEASEEGDKLSVPLPHRNLSRRLVEAGIL